MKELKTITQEDTIGPNTIKLIVGLDSTEDKSPTHDISSLTIYTFCRLSHFSNNSNLIESVYSNYLGFILV